MIVQRNIFLLFVLIYFTRINVTLMNFIFNYP